MSSNSLTYSVAAECLWGAIGVEKFCMRAWSGGGRGRTGSGAETSLSSYDTMRKERKTEQEHIRGGPLPLGFYLCRYIQSHKKFRECIFLEQTLSSLLHVDMMGNVKFHDRDRFYIHGRGQLGSDGCIVPQDGKERLRLNSAIKLAKGIILLQVKDEGMPVPDRMRTAVMTA